MKIAIRFNSFAWTNCAYLRGNSKKHWIFYLHALVVEILDETKIVSSDLDTEIKIYDVVMMLSRKIPAQRLTWDMERDRWRLCKINKSQRVTSLF